MATKSGGMEPNFTQTPNVIIDEYLRYLDHRAGESAVIMVLIRQTYGWHKPTAAVSTTFLARLTGMGRDTCAKALDSLSFFGLAEKRGENDPTKNHGAYYALQLDEGKIDASGLKGRYEASKARRSIRVAAMREAKAQKQVKSGDYPVYDIDSPLSMTQTAPLSMTQTDKTKGKETQNKPLAATTSAAFAAVGNLEADVPFSEKALDSFQTMLGRKDKVWAERMKAPEAVRDVAVSVSQALGIVPTKSQLSFWAKGAAELYEVLAGNPALIATAVAEMRGKGLAMSSPKSLVTTVQRLRATVSVSQETDFQRAQREALEAELRGIA